MDEFTLNDGGSNPGSKGFRGNTLQQLPVVDWLADLPETQLDTELVEVQFKNTRKGYYLNNLHLRIQKGDMVAVEALPGHDIGTVTLTGRLVLSQIKKNRINMERYEVKRVYRKVRPTDMEKYEEAKAKEHDTMIRARKIAQEMKLDMKIGDVEYQGDGSKAIFYYIADERVDFRQLIKVFAEVFRVRIEMKQIGARQEAGRIGGIGPCGRELCCTTWMSNFVSVSTVAARYQDLSTNPMKLAGQCAKIKCCVNFEAPMYMDAQKDFPSKDVRLETLDGTYYHFKTDVFKRQITYSTSENVPANLVTIPVGRALEIIAANNRGEKVVSLVGDMRGGDEHHDFQNVVGQDSLTRFDNKKGRKQKGNKGGQDKNGRPKAEAKQPKPAQQRTSADDSASKRDGGQRDNGKNDGGQQPRRDNRKKGDRRPQQGGGENRREKNNGKNTGEARQK